MKKSFYVFIVLLMMLFAFAGNSQKYAPLKSLFVPDQLTTAIDDHHADIERVVYQSLAFNQTIGLKVVAIGGTIASLVRVQLYLHNHLQLRLASLLQLKQAVLLFPFHDHW